MILVGSSVGGYVATVASSFLNTEGLFLLAQAFYMPGYPEQNPVPNAQTVSVIHGWNDDVIPVEHSIRFAQKFSAMTRIELHLIEDDHRLSAQLPFLEMLFGRFLDQVSANRALPRKRFLISPDLALTKRKLSMRPKRRITAEEAKAQVEEHLREAREEIRRSGTAKRKADPRS